MASFNCSAFYLSQHLFGAAYRIGSDGRERIGDGQDRQIHNLSSRIASEANLQNEPDVIPQS